MRALMQSEVKSGGAARRLVGVMTGAVAMVLFATGAFAGDDHRSARHKRHDSSSYERHHDHRWDDDRRRYRDRRDWSDYRAHSRYREPSWRYHSGRYWAPADYRGRHCGDRRHHRDVHYHVLARDYYDYYYPRYRYYGPAPIHADASVIITLPLF